LHKELAPERMAKRVPTAVAPITKSTCTNDRASITPSVRIKWPRSPVTTSWSITSPLRWQNKGRQRLGHPQRQQQCQAAPLRSKAAGDEPLSQAHARCRATGNHRIGHISQGEFDLPSAMRSLGHRGLLLETGPCRVALGPV